MALRDSSLGQRDLNHSLGQSYLNLGLSSGRSKSVALGDLSLGQRDLNLGHWEILLSDRVI